MKSVLIVTNSLDLAADLVVERLRDLSVRYTRLDLDLLSKDSIVLDPTMPSLSWGLEGKTLEVLPYPTAIFYRAPTHLRESSGHRYSPEELLQRHQWAAFARALCVFERALWISSPNAIYTAESKPFQLYTAQRVGFEVLQTFVANTTDVTPRLGNLTAIKALDSFLLRVGSNDLFFYTSSANLRELGALQLKDMPVILQEYVKNKHDLRVTVVNEDVFAAELVDKVEGDWRLVARSAAFIKVELPDNLNRLCIELVKRLNLKYGAIDLVRIDDRYIFLEINPTGEWAWLDDTFGGGISDSIVKQLQS